MITLFFFTDSPSFMKKRRASCSLCSYYYGKDYLPLLSAHSFFFAPFYLANFFFTSSASLHIHKLVSILPAGIKVVIFALHKVCMQARRPST